jgi:small subunit ribosomal protein S3
VGQKIHPEGLRLGYIKDWHSKWFSIKQMPDLLEEDRQIRKYLRAKLQGAAVSRISIERAGKHVRVSIFTARPGIVIGKKGADIENIRQDVERIVNGMASSRAVDPNAKQDPNSRYKVFVNVMEIKRPELDAQLVAEGVAMQLEKKVGFRRVMKKTIERTMAAGALGIKVRVSGRLGGAEIARVEWMKEGRVPLQTFRADIDYGFHEALITMGRIGCKVWIFKKELFKKTREDLMEEVKLVPKEELEQLAAAPAPAAPVEEPTAAPDEDLLPEENA